MSVTTARDACPERPLDPDDGALKGVGAGGAIIP
jgi:hypothetical protein